MKLEKKMRPVILFGIFNLVNQREKDTKIHTTLLRNAVLESLKIPCLKKIWCLSINLLLNN